MQNSTRGLIKYGCNGLSCKCLNDVYRFDTRADVSPIERIKVKFTCQSNRCNQPLLPYLSNRSVLARYWTVATVFYQFIRSQDSNQERWRYETTPTALVQESPSPEKWISAGRHSNSQRLSTNQGKLMTTRPRLERLLQCSARMRMMRTTLPCSQRNGVAAKVRRMKDPSRRSSIAPALSSRRGHVMCRKPPTHRRERKVITQRSGFISMLG